MSEQIQHNKSVVLEYVAAFNAGDSDRLRGLFAPDAVIHGVLGWGPIKDVIPIWRELHHAFGLQLQVDDIIAEGDSVAVRYMESGTFKAAFRGKQPTGKSYELIAMEWFVLRDGKIARRWGVRDAASQAKQLGM